ncbi:hypothetical protein CFP56_021995 [Quercus suber]|uniref:Uncharacterized protein n=1 Tax=Quercus suber TaxID=58331 RepID=A0AAW0KE42_QUESU
MSKMNIDITASAKPEYPVLDRDPPFTRVSVTVGYLSGIKPGIRGPSM